MNCKESTLNFVSNFVLPNIYEENITKDNLKNIVTYIEEEFEKPLSVKLASGENIDFEFFTLVNNVIVDLLANE